MDSNIANQLSNEFESALSEILPGLYQSLQQHQVSSPLEIDLEPGLLEVVNMTTCVCCIVNGAMKCGPMYQPPAPGANEDTLGLGIEQAQQLCKDVASKLHAVLPGLSQSIKQTGGSFEVHFFIDPAKANDRQPVVCQWVGGAPQGNILQCSSS